VRINQAGCLDRCEEGPVVVVYPQGTWYTYVDTRTSTTSSTATWSAAKWSSA
jgi:(2Fe-2S) ferredoxin